MNDICKLILYLKGEIRVNLASMEGVEKTYFLGVLGNLSMKFTMSVCKPKISLMRNVFFKTY